MGRILFNLVIGIALVVLACVPGNSLAVYAAVMGGAFIGYATCLWAARRRG